MQQSCCTFDVANRSLTFPFDARVSLNLIAVLLILFNVSVLSMPIELTCEGSIESNHMDSRDASPRTSRNDYLYHSEM